MKHHDYLQHAIDGPHTNEHPTKVDLVLLWLSGFVAGFLFALFTTGN